MSDAHLVMVMLSSSNPLMSAEVTACWALTEKFAHTNRSASSGFIFFVS